MDPGNRNSNNVSMRFYWNPFIELQPKKSEGVSSDKVLDSRSNLPGTVYMLVNMFVLSFVLVHEDKKSSPLKEYSFMWLVCVAFSAH